VLDNPFRTFATAELIDHCADLRWALATDRIEAGDSPDGLRVELAMVMGELTRRARLDIDDRTAWRWLLAEAGVCSRCGSTARVAELVAGLWSGGRWACSPCARGAR
jgi:hypothetical protein